MLNHVILMGRLTQTPELRTTQSGTSVTTFTIAVDRGYGDKKETDFISCVAWRGTADFITQYFTKGKMIAVEGSIQTRNYEKDGKKVYVTEVNVNGASFCGDKEEKSEPKETIFVEKDSFEILPDNDDDGLPF